MNAVREIPVDDTLPHVIVALDPALMQAYFQSHLNHTIDNKPTENAIAFQVIDCKIKHVKYKAGKKCVIGYSITLERRPERAAKTSPAVLFECITLDYAARVFPIGDSLRQFRKAQSRPVVKPPVGPPLLHIPELEMVVWAFPNDRKMTGIPTLLDAARDANGKLQQLAQLLCGKEWQLDCAEHQLVHYVPEHTCTVNAHLSLQNNHDSLQNTHDHATKRVVLYGKSYYNDDGAETWRLMSELWFAAQARQHSFRTAKPLSYDADKRILWQAGLNGRTLLTYQEQGSLFAELVAEAAEYIAQLHSVQLSCTKVNQLGDWLQQMIAVSALVEKVQPHLAPRVAELIDRLCNLSSALATEPEATLHGDLHWQNFLVDESQLRGQRIALIDLDSLSSGSPWMDLGSFFAGLIYRSLLEAADNNHAVLFQVDELINTILTSYQAHSPWPLDLQAIHWYTAAALINERVYRSISRLKPGRLALLERLLQVAEENVATAEVSA